MGIIIFGFIFGICSLIVVYFCNTYNRLIEIKNVIDDNWQSLLNDIKYRFQLMETFLPVVSEYISNEDMEDIKKLIANYPILVTNEDIINIAIKLERYISTMYVINEEKKFINTEWNKAFTDNRNSIVNKRIVYNDNVLKYNSILLAQRSVLVGKIAHLNTLAYYRSED